MSPKKRSSYEQRRLRAQQIMFVILAVVVILSMVVSLTVK
jgi:predicted nucleic acid-binding Zn ribbon protein